MLIEINNVSATSEQKKNVLIQFNSDTRKKYLEYFYTFHFFIRKYHEKFGIQRQEISTREQKRTPYKRE